MALPGSRSSRAFLMLAARKKERSHVAGPRYEAVIINWESRRLETVGVHIEADLWGQELGDRDGRLESTTLMACDRREKRLMQAAEWIVDRGLLMPKVVVDWRLSSYSRGLA